MDISRGASALDDSDDIVPQGIASPGVGTPGARAGDIGLGIDNGNGTGSGHDYGFGEDEEEDGDIGGAASGNGGMTKERKLPDDLPTSLDDRRVVGEFVGGETEYYDGWQGQAQYMTPITAKSLAFNLSLDNSTSYDEDQATAAALEDNDARLMEMLAAQAAHREDDGSNGGDEDAIATDEDLSVDEKRDILQRALNMAASNGDTARVERLVNGKAKAYVDVNMPDEEGTAPLIYASCFGHGDVVSKLLEAGAVVDKQDRNRWTPLMWAMTNRHKGIAKTLLDHGASMDIKSSSGGTLSDFVQPNTDFSRYLSENGYHIGGAGVGAGAGGVGDFYDAGGFAQDRFEEEMAENEMRRRMMMEESAINLEVDLSTLGFDEKPESPDELEEDQQEFVWERCLPDQMFVFQNHELERILDLIITHMTPQRSPSQKPVPANLLFLAARYAHYHASPELLAELLTSAMDKINLVVDRHQWDMTMLAFWISNATLLLHYLKKDPGLVESTNEFQAHLAELINEIFILIIRDAERRINKNLDTAMLDHETIPGFEDVQFQNEWKLFRSKTKPKAPEPAEKRFRPPSPKRRMQTSPRNVTSLLSSTLFVLDLYDVHSIIIAQILAQLIYWLGSELFNRIMTTRRYLARTKAMQIRMNISALEDWARANNRQPEHYENGSTTSTGENTVDAARRHLAPVIQLLQWLQCFSSLPTDDPNLEALKSTLQQMQRLTPTQLIHTAKNYRPEVGEKGLPKPAMKYLNDMQYEIQKRRTQGKKSGGFFGGTASSSTPGTPDRKGSATPNPTAQDSSTTTPSTPTKPTTTTTPDPNDPSTQNGNNNMQDDSDPEFALQMSQTLLLDPALMLPFFLPTSTDMLITYGAGFGGVNKERAKKYIPTVPTEVLGRLDVNGGK